MGEGEEDLFVSFFTHMHEFFLRCSGTIIGFNLCMIFGFNFSHLVLCKLLFSVSTHLKVYIFIAIYGFPWR